MVCKKIIIFWPSFSWPFMILPVASVSYKTTLWLEGILLQPIRSFYFIMVYKDKIKMINFVYHFVWGHLAIWKDVMYVLLKQKGDKWILFSVEWSVKSDDGLIAVYLNTKTKYHFGSDPLIISSYRYLIVRWWGSNWAQRPLRSGPKGETGSWGQYKTSDMGGSIRAQRCRARNALF